MTPTRVVPIDDTTVATVATPPRMSLANVRRGSRKRPIRALVYGAAAVGKSTFGATAPKPIFLSLESGLDELDVASLPEPNNWPEAIEAVSLLLREDHDYQTVVVDTADWLEKLLHVHIVGSCPKGKSTMKECHGGYQAAYELALNEFRRFLFVLERLWDERSMNILLLAHGVWSRATSKDGDDYSMMRPGLWHSEKASASDLLVEWSYATVLLATEVFTRSAKGEKTKGVGGTDVYAHTVGRAPYVAKCRYKGVPERVKITEENGWDDLFGARSVAETRGAAEIATEIRDLISRLPEEQRGKADEFYASVTGNIPEMLKMLTQLRVAAT